MNIKPRYSKIAYKIKGASNIKANIKLLNYQNKILNSKKQTLAFIGGTGSGKSWFAPRWQYFKMLENPGNEHIVSSPTFPMLKRTIIPKMLQFYEKDLGLVLDKDFTYSKSDYTFEFKKLGIIYCISAMNSDRMQGIHAKTIVGDEAGMFSRLWYDTAIQRIGFTQGQILLTTTPYALNWLYQEVFKTYLKDKSDIELVNPTSIDNPYYPVKSFLKAKQKLPLWKFLMMYMAKFTKPAGLIYPKYTLCKPFKIPASWKKIRGFDFGFNNPSAEVFLAQSPDTGNWYAYKEFKKSGMDIDDLEKKMSEENSKIYADPSAKQIIAQLKNKGINIKEANNAVMDGILYISSLFRKRKLIIFDNLVHLKDELSTYQWSKNKEENLTDSPVKENDHLLDALRYALFTDKNSKVPYLSSAKAGDRIDKAIEDAFSTDIDNILNDDDDF